MLFIVLLLDFFLNSNGLQTTYASLHINSTWKFFCKDQTMFRTALSNFISLNTEGSIQSTQILFLNAEASCAKAGKAYSSVYLSVSIRYPAPNSEKEDVALLSKMTTLLKTGTNVGGMQVISATLVTDKESSEPSIPQKTVFIIIGAVLAVYLLGYFCVVSTQSDSYNEAILSKVYVVSTANKEFDGMHFAGVGETYGDKRL